MDQNHAQAGEPVTYESLAGRIDFHALRPEMTDDELADACTVARDYNVASLVVRPSDVDQALRWLEGSGVTLASTVGFPDGSTTTAVKLYEGRDLLRRGVKELEMVVNTGKLISRQFQFVETELMQMAKSCLESGALLKVLVRNELLSDDLKIILLKICKRIEAGYFSIAHSAQDLALLTPLLKERIELKAWAAGSLEDALALREAGYARIGTTQPGVVLDAWRARLEAMAQTAAAVPPS